MMTCSGYDRLGPLLERLRECLCDALDDADVPVCRCSLLPGRDVVWDMCCEGDGCEGQAWVQAEDSYTSQDFPQPDFEAAPCTTYEMAATITLGIMRCSQAFGTDQGDPPDADRLDYESLRVLDDAALMRKAIRCCFAAEMDRGEVRIGRWEGLGPEGGCVGGQQQVLVAFSDCGC